MIEIFLIIYFVKFTCSIIISTTLTFRSNYNKKRGVIGGNLNYLLKSILSITPITVNIFIEFLYDLLINNLFTLANLLTNSFMCSSMISSYVYALYSHPLSQTHVLLDHLICVPVYWQKELY